MGLFSNVTCRSTPCSLFCEVAPSEDLGRHSNKDVRVAVIWSLPTRGRIARAAMIRVL